MTRAYIVEQCEPSQRTAVLGLLTAVQVQHITSIHIISHYSTSHHITSPVVLADIVVVVVVVVAVLAVVALSQQCFLKEYNDILLSIHVSCLIISPIISPITTSSLLLYWLDLPHAVQYAGFTVSPAIGSGMVANLAPNSYWLYALPPYFIALMVGHLSAIVHHCYDILQHSLLTLLVTLPMIEILPSYPHIHTLIPSTFPVDC